MDYDFSAQNALLHSYTPRVALITGAAQGIGYAIAHRLADDGIDIAVNDIHAKNEQVAAVVAEIQKKGRRAIAAFADVSKESEVVEMIKRTVEELGSLDIMVANAGIARTGGFLETTVETFDEVTAVDLRGVFLCYKHAALQMIKQERGGRILGASSSVGKESALNLCSYVASKFGVRGLTQSLALELRKNGITVNCYAPGAILTDLTTRFNNADGTIDEDEAGITLKKTIGLPPETPTAKADSVASLVSYIAKPESYFMTAQTISMDGGLRPS